MRIFKSSKKHWKKYSFDTRCIVYIDSKYIEFGYDDITENSILIQYKNDTYWLNNINNCFVPLYYRNDTGTYSLDKRAENNIKRVSKHTWPYPIEKSYGFSKLALKPPKYDIAVDSDFDFIYNFSIGLEYETNAGNIPWDICRKLGLVPLYDGSILGHEYVTFPLHASELPIIQNQLKTLEQYTTFDHNCSLHVHFGNFPISFDCIDRLVKSWDTFQYSLLEYLPLFSYNTELYKDNHKSYNKMLCVDNLKDFYETYTGNKYIDETSLYLPNKFDEEEFRKWEVVGRYHNMNIMHLLSGKSHKTVEFRFLHPTYDYLELKWYILVLGAFLQYVINNDKVDSNISVVSVINSMFTGKLKLVLLEQGVILKHLSKMQVTSNDGAGICQIFKSTYFKYNSLKNVCL